MSTLPAGGESPGATVALVFVATDEADLLLAALGSLHAAPHPGMEVVVVDNASADEVAEAVHRRWPGARILRQGRRRGLYTNLNAGVTLTGAPYVMVCNCDIAFSPHAVARLAEFLDRHPRAAAAAPQLRSPAGDRLPSARRWYTPGALLALRWPWVREPLRYPSVQASRYADWDHGEPRPVDWVHCPATMFRRAALDAVGGFDERFRIYCGDLEVCMRLHQAGWEVWCVPEAVVVHAWQRASARALSGAWFSHLDSMVRLIARHRGLRPRPAPAPTSQREVIGERAR